MGRIPVPDNLARVSRSVYVASPEGQTGKSAVALGLLDALTREVGSVGVFRPLTTVGTALGGTDLIVDLLVNQPGVDQTYDEALGVTYDAARTDADEALHTIVERFGVLADRYEVVLVLGSDYADVSSGTELSFNAKIAANLGSPWCWSCTAGNVPRSRSAPPPRAPSPSCGPTTPGPSR